jgi:hypothetical protein
MAEEKINKTMTQGEYDPQGDGALDSPRNVWAYQATSKTADTVDDTRWKSNAGAVTWEKCTVANATKGGGTWVALGTIHPA